MKNQNIYLGLLLLCVSFFGCENDNGITYVTKDNLLNKNNITDVTAVFEKVEQEGQTIYYGNRKGKDWFALFDDAGNLQKEWYGKDYYYIPTENVLAGSAYSVFKEFEDTYTLVFGGQAFHLYDDQQVEYGFKVDWYIPTMILSKNRFLLRIDSEKTNVCYDFKGNVIAEDTYYYILNTISLFTGFQDEKVWVAYDDEEKGWQEFVSTETFERNRSIHLGYGEYKAIYVENIKPLAFLKTNWGFVFIPEMYSTLFSDIVFLCKDGNVFAASCDVRDFKLQNWYNDTFLVDRTKVLSSFGEIIIEFTEQIPYSTEVEPVSITDGVHFTHSYYYNENEFVRRNYEKGIDVWCVTIPQLDDIQENAKVTMTLLEKGASIWKYSCQVLNYDGSQNTFELNLNVETGELF